MNMQKENWKDKRRKRVKENAELARNKIRFDCFGLDYFGMQRFAHMGAQIVCMKEINCRHECRFRRDAGK